MKNTWLKLAGVAVAVVAFGGSAYANPVVPEITLSIDGNAPISTVLNPVDDSTVSDFNDHTSARGWKIDNAIGTLLDASVTTPSLDLASLDVKTTGAGTMTIEFLYTGIGPLGAYSLDDSISGSGITQTVSVIDFGPIVGPAIETGDKVGPSIQTGSEFGIFVTLTSGVHGGTASIDDIVTVPTVPDGGTTVALLGLALGCCGMFARRLKKA